MADEDTDACNLHTRKLIIFKRWRIEEKLTSGGFGAIYRARDDVDKSNPKVIIKTERRIGKDYLTREEKVYKRLKGQDGFPKMYIKGKLRYTSKGVKKNCTALVMETLGPSLSDLFYQGGKRFSLKTVLMLGDQMIKRLEQIHDAGILHRDIKPGNFVMGIGANKHKVYLIDFGLANFYIENGMHVAYKEDAPFRGTHRYASLNAHMKVEQSRRDDLEGLGHVLIYFLKGGLPWQNVDCSRKKRRKVIGQAKANLSISKLCEGLPSEFQEYMETVRNVLKFSARPDYRRLRKLFGRCMKNLNFKRDYQYDWTEKTQLTDTSSTTTLASNNPNSLSSFSSDAQAPPPTENQNQNTALKRSRPVSSPGSGDVIDLVEDDDEQVPERPTKRQRVNPLAVSGATQPAKWADPSYLPARPPIPSNRMAPSTRAHPRSPPTSPPITPSAPANSRMLNSPNPATRTALPLQFPDSLPFSPVFSPRPAQSPQGSPPLIEAQSPSSHPAPPRSPSLTGGGNWPSSPQLSPQASFQQSQ
eukprot:TRINITY_DN84_c0_g2_i1.p1 TRINITY_DN84_c0_g2~~TRINITY_DN84_c0_g2_i1.p1  ORF type:complete len:529 (+),score=63.95 TRINITY_DN84_c0_g2_i1:127-1713(+)